MLPNFLIIGSQKAGTSSIYEILKKHPQIYMSPIKEINFFTNNKRFKYGIRYYEKFFQDAPLNKKAVGEATPGYICHPDVPKKIRRYLPNIKLILIVRNPIDRAYSQYWHNRRVLSEELTFNETIKIALNDTYLPGKRGYFSRGIYIKFINAYLAYFDLNQILVMVFDELRDNPKIFFKKIFNFLGVDTSFESTDISKAFNTPWIWNNVFYKYFFFKQSYQRYLNYLPQKMKTLLYWGKRIDFHYPPIDLISRCKLIKFYEPWNNELSTFLGIDLSMWKREATQ